MYIPPPVKSSEDSTFPARFFARGVPDANGCLNWTGTVSNFGRGQLKFDGKKTTAQRVAWQIANGSIPDGMRVYHICRNPLCIRVAHLTLKTVEEVSALHLAEISLVSNA